MGTRAQALAEQFEQAFADLANTVEGASEKQWAAICGDERWTVAATAQHVGAQLPLEREYISAAAEGREMPAYTWEDINGMNEKRAKDKAACSKADVLKLLRDGGASAAAYVRGLSDDQLDRRSRLPLAGGAEVTTQQLIEGGVLIDHAVGHLKSIRAAG